MSNVKFILKLVLSMILWLVLYGMVESVGFACNKAGIIIESLVYMMASIALIFIYFLCEKGRKNREVTELKMSDSLCLTAKGLLTGIIYISLVIVAIAVCGSYHIDSVSFKNNALISFVFSFLTVAIGEEIIFRGILYRKVRDNYGKAWALAISALLFGFMHIGNDNADVWGSIAICLEAGLLLAAAYEYYNSLWFPIGIHWAWNYAESVIYGSACSGQVTPSIISPTFSGHWLITGGDFGIEASIFSVLIGLCLTYLFLRKKNIKETDSESQN